MKCSIVGNLWISENDWYVEGDARTLYEALLFLAFVTVALQPTIT
jgi:hypothetical protein